MTKSVHSRYDKRLKKYHIEYHRLHDDEKAEYRINILNRLNTQSDMAVMIDTQLGSVNEPEPLNFARTIEGIFTKYHLQYQVRPHEVASGHRIFGIISGSKKTVTHYAITFIIEKGTLTREMFDDLLCEFDTQVGYRMLKSPQVLFEDMQKGYIDNVFDEGYFEASLYDSRIFDKFLATEDLTAI